jgi:hypothetical protein
MSSLVQRAVGVFRLAKSSFYSPGLFLGGLQELQDDYYEGKPGVQTPMTAEDFDALTQAIAQGEPNEEADAQSIFPVGSRMCAAQMERISGTLYAKYNRGNVKPTQRPGLRRRASGAGPAPAPPVEPEDIDKVIKDLEDGLKVARQARIEADQKAVEARANEEKLSAEHKGALERKRKREAGQ